MNKDVKVKVFFRPDPKKKSKQCKPLDTIGELLNMGKLELAVQAMMAETLFHVEDNVQKITVSFMTGLMNHQVDRGWVWIKGKRKTGETHYWLECDGWAIDPTDVPGMKLKVEKNSILIMDAASYRKTLKLKVLTEKKPKQVSQWLMKQKNKVENQRVVPKPTPAPHAPPKQPEPKPRVEKAEKPAETEAAQPKPAAAEFDPDDKKAYKTQLTNAANSMKKEGKTNTEIAAFFIEKKLPTRSGRGSWNPRMVSDLCRDSKK